MDDLVAAAKDLVEDLRAGRWRDSYWWIDHQWLLLAGAVVVDVGVTYLKLSMQRRMLGGGNVEP
jgi:hypothetical protein